MQPQITALIKQLQDQIDAIKKGGVGGGASSTAVTALSGTAAATDIFLSGTFNSALQSLSGTFVTVMGFLTGTGISSVAHDATLSGLGTSGTPLSAGPTYTSLSTAVTSSIGSLYTSVTVGASASIAALSGTANSAIVSLSSTINSAIGAIPGPAALSGTIDAAFKSYDVLRHQVTGALNFSSPTGAEVIRFSGMDQYVGATSQDGVGALLGVNLQGNRELFLFETPFIRSPISGALRFIIGPGTPTLEALATDLTPLTLRLQALGGDTQLNGQSRHQASVQITGALWVSGSITATGNVIAPVGAFSVGVAATGLNISSRSELTGVLDVTGSVKITGSLSVLGSILIGGASLSVTSNAFPTTTTNLSTTGTVDWYWYGNSGSPATGCPPNWSVQTATAYHWKKGGLLYQSLTWFGAGASSAPSTFPGTSAFMTTAADDSYGVALSASDGTYMLVTGPVGYQINIPASPTARTLRIYCGAKSVTITIAASLDDGSAANASATFNAASGVNVQQAVDVVFKAGSSTRLRVTVTATTLNGGVQAVELWGLAQF